MQHIHNPVFFTSCENLNEKCLDRCLVVQNEKGVEGKKHKIGNDLSYGNKCLLQDTGTAVLHFFSSLCDHPVLLPESNVESFIHPLLCHVQEFIEAFPKRWNIVEEKADLR